MESTASQTLASFATGLRWQELPPEVIAAAKRHLLDALGVALASSTMPFADKAFSAIDELGAGSGATVIGRARPAPPAWAALANGTLIHGLDFDDTHSESVVHVSAGVVPAALAAAEQHGASGRDLLAAIAVGLECNIRLGLVARGAFHDRGFHPTGICGTFAAALSAARLGGASAATAAHALGLCLSMAAGSLEFLSDGSWAKRMHGGWAAHAGLVAARFAARGFSGPRGALDGRFGLYRSHLGNGGWDLAALAAGLGEHWEMLRIGMKPYPCCHFNHAFLDAAARLRQQPGVVAGAIDRVVCHIAPREMPIVCEPIAGKRRPQTDYDAKFSLPYTVARMLLYGHVDIDDFTAAAIADEATLHLAARVDCVADPSADYPRHFPGRLRIHLRDGRMLEHSEAVHRGSADRPLSNAEVRDKFARNAARALPERQAQRLAEYVDVLDGASDVNGLAALLVPAPASAEASSR
jgi:2-methylcitrate dehydratase PrpD